MTESFDGLPPRRRVIAVVAISMGSLMQQIDALIASVTLPTLASTLHVASASTVLVVTVYQLVLAMTLLPLAALGDRMGHRRLYCAGLMLHLLATSLYVFVDSLPAVILVRVLQAMGTAAAMSVSVAMLRGIYPLSRLGAGLALNTVANAGGTSLAPVLGGLVLSVANWRWAFAAVVPLSIGTLLLSRALPDPEPRAQPFDMLGALLCALTFGLLIGGLESAIHGSHLLLSLGVIALGVVIGWLFIRHEGREPQPVLPIDLLTQPIIALSVISCFTAVLGSIILILFMPFRLQQGYGFAPGEIGGMMAVYAVGSLSCAPLAGFLSDRIRVAVLSTIGITMACAGLLLVAFLPDHPSHFDIAWRIWMCGAGFGTFFSPNARLIIASAPKARTAAAGSIFTTTRMLGQATGATLSAALLSMGLGQGPWPAVVAACLAASAGAMSIYSLFSAKHRSTVVHPGGT
jgi:DHA2 family multidrug resistance protein-like MFS transporter